MPEHKKHFTITEAARIAEVSRPLLYRAIQDGSLRTWRTWSRGTVRIHKEDLEAWMCSPSAQVETASTA